MKSIKPGGAVTVLLFAGLLIGVIVLAVQGGLFPLERPTSAAFDSPLPTLYPTLAPAPTWSGPTTVPGHPTTTATPPVSPLATPSPPPLSTVLPPLPTQPPMPGPTADLTGSLLDFTKRVVPVLSGTPEVVFARTVTLSELKRLHLARVPQMIGPEPSMKLFLLKGDFDMRHASLGPMRGISKASYIVYVYDMTRQGIVLTIAVPPDRLSAIAALLALAGEPIPTTSP